ncbi:hypothetical protein J6590_061959 [Homalodisca vitripennis]|nr:hypothetical protein J6590_061959 [Homalodisca vitripennis]
MYRVPSVFRPAFLERKDLVKVLVVVSYQYLSGGRGAEAVNWFGRSDWNGKRSYLGAVAVRPCQIIRKSIELPVKDYLSSPRSSRAHGDGKDPLYVLGGNIDSVRSFEVLSPHTPASSLMFADLAKRTNTKVSTPHPAHPNVEPVVENRGRSGENKIPNLFLPATPPTIDFLDSRFRYGKLSSNNLVSSPVTSPRSLDLVVNSKKGYSFSFTAPSVDYPESHGQQAAAQEFIPNYSTPFPSLYQNNDAVFGYFNQFQTHNPTTPEDVVGRQAYDYSHYVTPVPPEYIASSYEEGVGSLHSIPPLPYNIPPIYNQSKGSDERYSKTKETHARSKNSGEEESSPEKSEKDENPLPSVPPTIGVIGWKSNTDHDTSWKPNKALMGIANEYIKEDMKNDGNKKENSTQYPNKSVEENSGKYESHKNIEEEGNSEAEDQGDDEEEEEEEENSEEEEEEENNDEEEDEGYESEEVEDYDDDENKSEPPVPPPSYSPPSYSAENSGSSEHNQYENDPYPPIFYDDAPTLPPGPPYYPPPHEQDSRTNFGGYVPPPSFSLGVPPFESIEKDVLQTWTPVTPRTNGGSWPNSGESVLLNGSPEEGGFHFFQWNKFRHSKSPKEEERNTSTKSRYNSSREDSRYNDERRDNNGLTTPFRNGYIKKRIVKSKVDPLKHNRHRDLRGDRSESFEVTDKEGSGPTPPPLDSEERERVSDHEFPRKVPTRLRYPGGGLWAKPQPDSGIDLGFVPKKTYTQTRRHNTVKHLPRDAALSQASTQEELVNAPRLREVVSHKKTQEDELEQVMDLAHFWHVTSSPVISFTDGYITVT